jgi:hypothetical protein
VRVTSSRDFFGLEKVSHKAFGHWATPQAPTWPLDTVMLAGKLLKNFF